MQLGLSCLVDTSTPLVEFRYLKALEDILPTQEGRKVVMAEARHAHKGEDVTEEMLDEARQKLRQMMREGGAAAGRSKFSAVHPRFTRTKSPRLKVAAREVMRENRVASALGDHGDNSNAGGGIMQAVEHSASEVDAVFRKLDSDKSGFVDAHELKQYFKMANGETSLQRRKTAAKLLKFFDKNADGLISIEEFRDGMEVGLCCESGYCGAFHA